MKFDKHGKRRNYLMKANAEHFFKAFEHCMKCKFTSQQAMVMSCGFSRRGFIDASEGCAHYAMMLLVGASRVQPPLPLTKEV